MGVVTWWMVIVVCTIVEPGCVWGSGPALGVGVGEKERIFFVRFRNRLTNEYYYFESKAMSND